MLRIRAVEYGVELLKASNSASSSTISTPSAGRDYDDEERRITAGAVKNAQM
jgi:apolipoprotein N-acyltransferase